MRKEVTLVPKRKNPLEVIAELGAQTANSWIFLHKNAIEILKSTADTVDVVISFLKMDWKETDIFHSTTIYIESFIGEWARIYQIDSEDIKFKNSPINPENLFFLQMED